MPSATHVLKKKWVSAGFFPNSPLSLFLRVPPPPPHPPRFSWGMYLEAIDRRISYLMPLGCCNSSVCTAMVGSGYSIGRGAFFFFCAHSAINQPIGYVRSSCLSVQRVRQRAGWALLHVCVRAAYIHCSVFLRTLSRMSCTVVACTVLILYPGRRKRACVFFIHFVVSLKRFVPSSFLFLFFLFRVLRGELCSGGASLRRNYLRLSRTAHNTHTLV